MLRLFPLLSMLGIAMGISATTLTVDDLKHYHEVNEYIVTRKPSKAVTDSILATLPTGVTLADIVPLLDSSLPDLTMWKAVDGLYLTEGLRAGCTLDEARDAVSFTTHFPFRRPNARDYQKLYDVFSTTSPILHRLYLEKIPFMLRNSGASPECEHLSLLIRENVAPSPLKDSSLKILDDYMAIAPGRKAPQVPLLDAGGTSHQFSQFAGKTVVIDVWATWCVNCLKKMPEFLALAESYKDAPVVFLTVSIDRPDLRDKWLAMSAKQKLPEATNLLAVTSDGAPKSAFEQTYCIGGVPRCIVINPDGTIADAFAPTKVAELRTLIDSTFSH